MIILKIFIFSEFGNFYNINDNYNASKYFEDEKVKKNWNSYPNHKFITDKFASVWEKNRKKLNEVEVLRFDYDISKTMYFAGERDWQGSI